MRQIILDTETTGLDAKQGHRIIELAAVEMIDRRPTGRNLHLYLDPEREVDAGAAEVHGMNWDDLRDKPKFRDIAAEFIEFARGATWVIHNAPFDVGFLDHEFAREGLGASATLYDGLLDTLAMAREAFPGKRNNLDALCERLGVSNAHRTLHGALLDANLLAEVYLAMTRGQETLTIDMGSGPAIIGSARSADATLSSAARPALVVIIPTSEELAAHQAYLAALARDAKGGCLWLRDTDPAVQA
jgi:DNA polymerase III subunit epsilon